MLNLKSQGKKQQQWNLMYPYEISTHIKNSTNIHPMKMAQVQVWNCSAPDIMCLPINKLTVDHEMSLLNVRRWRSSISPLDTCSAYTKDDRTNWNVLNFQRNAKSDLITETIVPETCIHFDDTVNLLKIWALQVWLLKYLVLPQSKLQLVWKLKYLNM